MDRAAVARHVTRCPLIKEMRVQNVVDDRAGNIWQAQPGRHDQKGDVLGQRVEGVKHLDHHQHRQRQRAGLHVVPQVEMGLGLRV